MLSAEEFSDIAKRAEDGGDITTAEGLALVHAVRRFDVLTFVFQQALEMTAANAVGAMNDLVVRMLAGEEEASQEKAEAAIQHVSELADQINSAIENYITTAVVTAAENLNVPVEELIGVTPETVGQPEDQAL
jgi:peptidyl-tRNA hydrolase